MKRNLKRKTSVVWHYNYAGERVEGPPAGVYGELTGVRGNLTGVYGDIDDCELSPEDRARGVHIDELIGD